MSLLLSHGNDIQLYLPSDVLVKLDARLVVSELLQDDVASADANLPRDCLCQLGMRAAPKHPQIRPGSLPRCPIHILGFCEFLLLLPRNFFLRCFDFVWCPYLAKKHPTFYYTLRSQKLYAMLFLVTMTTSLFCPIRD